MKKNIWLAVLVLLLGLSVGNLTKVLVIQGRIRNLEIHDNEDARFRSLTLSEDILEILEETSEKAGILPSDLLTVWMAQYNYEPDADKDLSVENYRIFKSYYQNLRTDAYEQLRESYQAIWDDVKYFPCSGGIRFENSWMFERTYGGKRGHEGTDLMPPKNKAGYYPVYSMTDGVVEQIGWLEQGGWRIGIRSSTGAYFYYAHLDSYARDFKIGDAVNAGNLLGYMGDTGYGEEGTRGKFDVHLHLGIYIQTAHYEELSVNPYWVLRAVEEHKLKYHGDLCYNQNNNLNREQGDGYGDTIMERNSKPLRVSSKRIDCKIRTFDT